MKRFSAVAAAGLLSVGLFVSGGAPAFAQTVSSDTIVESLKPKKPLTRSLSGKPKTLSAEDAAFLNDLPNTRGLRIDQRKKLDEIVAKQDLPKIDITINFDYDSDQIRPDSIAAVEELGKALTSDALAKAKIVLNGHTDAAGTDGYNLDLSNRRAASVRNFLIAKFSIDGERLVAIGYGEERLKNTGDPAAAENRRVEVINLTSG
jgi:outer membrane protein OmpA-like peptidoglycan-associated protein